MTLNFFPHPSRTRLSKYSRTRRDYALNIQISTRTRSVSVPVPWYGCVEVDGIRLLTSGYGLVAMSYKNSSLGSTGYYERKNKICL